MLTLIPDQFERFLEEDDGQPIVMLNLLRFHADGGRERYADYLAAAGPLVARYGAEIVTVGDGLPALSAENGRPGTPWRWCAIPIGKPSPAWSEIPSTGRRPVPPGGVTRRGRAAAHPHGLGASAKNSRLLQPSRRQEWAQRRVEIAVAPRITWATVGAASKGRNTTSAIPACSSMSARARPPVLPRQG